jgi:hypothetical protein
LWPVWLSFSVYHRRPMFSSLLSPLHPMLPQFGAQPPHWKYINFIFT